MTHSRKLLFIIAVVFTMLLCNSCSCSKQRVVSQKFLLLSPSCDDHEGCIARRAYQDTNGDWWIYFLISNDFNTSIALSEPTPGAVWTRSQTQPNKEEIEEIQEAQSNPDQIQEEEMAMESLDSSDVDTTSDTADSGTSDSGGDSGGDGGGE